MVKRGALSKVEKFYIEGHADLTVEDIAEELDRSVNIVQKHLDTVEQPKPKKTTTKKKAKKQPKDTQFQTLMGRHDRKGEKVATVMTRSASELADAQRPNRIANKKIQDAIHKPRG
jgi:predicted ArsR family transcriptional regulator